MPCDSITTMQVHLGLANRDMLEQTLRGLADAGTLRRYGKEFDFYRDGQRYRITGEGKLICREGLERTADVIKRAYSKQLVSQAARKFGWELSTKTPQKLTVRRKF